MKAKGFVPNATRAVSPDRTLNFHRKFENGYRTRIKNGRFDLRESWVHVELFSRPNLETEP